MLLTNKKKGWCCPRCPQICGRHWNFKVHVNRWHPDLSAEANTQEYDVSPDRMVGDGVIPTPQEEVGKVAYLASASNPDLMRWALMQNRLAQPANIQKWINLFESNEDRYMMNPITMLRDMKDYFAEKPGENSFNHFVQLIKDYGRKKAQFFKNPYFDEPRLHGKPDHQGQESKQYPRGGHEYTHPALPPGMPYYHPMTERSIRRYQEEKLEERKTKSQEVEKDGVRDAYEDYLRAKTLNLMQNRSGEGNGTTADPLIQISNLIAAGKMVPVLTIDANGNRSIRYELTALMQPQIGNVLDGLDNANYLKIIQTAYDERSEILMKLIEPSRGGHRTGKGLADSINRPQTNNIEPQKLKHEKHRLEGERNAPPNEEGKEPKYGTKQEMDKREETRGQEQGDKLFTTLNDRTNNRLHPFGAIFLDQAVEFQMPASVRELFGRLIQKGGQPQREYGPGYDLPAQQDLANHERKRKVRDQEFVNGIQRMQEAAIMERKKSNSIRRI